MKNIIEDIIVLNLYWRQKEIDIEVIRKVYDNIRSQYDLFIRCEEIHYEMTGSKNLPILYYDDEDLKSLENVFIGDETIDNLDFLSNLINLEELDIFNPDYNNFSDLSPISELINLKKIDIRRSNVSSILQLQKLRNLRELRIVESKLNSLNGIENLIQLELLDIGGNEEQINLEPIKNLHFLKYLYLDYSWSGQESDITSIKELNQLRQLHIKGIKEEHLYQVSQSCRKCKIFTNSISLRNLDSGIFALESYVVFKSVNSIDWSYVYSFYKGENFYKIELGPFMPEEFKNLKNNNIDTKFILERICNDISLSLLNQNERFAQDPLFLISNGEIVIGQYEIKYVS